MGKVEYLRLTFTGGIEAELDDVDPSAWVIGEKYVISRTGLGVRYVTLLDMTTERREPYVEPDYEALLRRLVDVEPHVVVDSDGRPTYCVWCDMENAHHDDDCPWVEARRAMGIE